MPPSPAGSYIVANSRDPLGTPSSGSYGLVVEQNDCFTERLGITYRLLVRLPDGRLKDIQAWEAASFK